MIGHGSSYTERQGMRLRVLLLVVLVIAGIAGGVAQVSAQQPYPPQAPDTNALRPVVSEYAVNIDNGKGGLMPNWRAFVRSQYPYNGKDGWYIGNPQKWQYWVVVVSRIAYTAPILPAVVVPTQTMDYCAYNPHDWRNCPHYN